jgi:hypothetical protein
MAVSKTKQRKRKARRLRAIDERLERATGVTTTSLKLDHPDYTGAAGVTQSWRSTIATEREESWQQAKKEGT